MIMAGEKAILEAVRLPLTVSVALAAFPLPTKVSRALVVLTAAPGELLVTLSCTVQIEFFPNLPPSKLMLLEPTVATKKPLEQVDSAFFGLAIVTPVGKVLVNVSPPTGVFSAELSIV